MPGKTGKKPNTKKSRSITSTRKLSPARIVLIILAIIIAFALILFSIWTPGTNKSNKSNEVSHTIHTPVFRADGTLSIFPAQSQKPVTLDIEIADQEEQRMQGLMYRYSMDEHQGMFFIFPSEEPRSFWMKNTYISLDIIYINAKDEIVSIQKYTQPRSTYSLPSDKPAKYVLEVNSGFTDKYGIKPGDKIEFSRVKPAA